MKTPVLLAVSAKDLIEIKKALKSGLSSRLECNDVFRWLPTDDIENAIKIVDSYLKDIIIENND